MTPYHKIQSLFKRDPDKNYKTFLIGSWLESDTWQWSRPEFEFLQNDLWVFTEKVDGTNIRVFWTGNTLTFGGKTDNAQIPVRLLAALQSRFNTAVLEAAFPDIDVDATVTLYGEGYGAKIQAIGSGYIQDANDFILFDVKVGDIWLQRKDVEDIAQNLGIKVVPVVGEGNIIDAISVAANPLKSKVAQDPGLYAEGIVLRPKVELLDRRGQRIISKLKYTDFHP